MPSVLVSTEIVIGTLLAIAAVILTVTYLRRRYIARTLPLTLCGLRSAGTQRWRLGLMRLGDDALEWFTLGGVSVRPRRRWSRQLLRLEAPVPLAGADSIPLLPEASCVPCTDGHGDFELALQASAYTALRSWQEAAPPGYNVNVA